MNSYWIIFPRNFGNEYTVGIASTKEDAESYEAEGYDRINRETAIYRLAERGDNATEVYADYTINGYEYQTPRQIIARRLRKGEDLT